MHNQHSGLSQLLATQRSSERHAQAAQARLVSGDRPPRRRYRSLVLAVMVVAAAVAMAPAAAADTPTITREIRHPFSTVQHFDPIPECGFPGATEYATGNDHLVIVDQGDSVHVTFGETFRILEVPDDPAFPTIERQGTDALHFNLTKSGTEVFTESFHDSSPPDFRIDYYRTFV
jgi:hypothetical protein